MAFIIRVLSLGLIPIALGDSFMVGDVEFIWKEFYCPVCKKEFRSTK